MSSGLDFSCSGEQATRKAVDGLTRRGFHVVRSFDLNTATDGACDCPHHGTARCTCQYVVLLVYDLSGPPAVVTAHSREDRSHLEVVADPNSPPDPRLVDRIVSALAEAGGSFAGSPCTPAADIGARIL
jgi:hypothetical protein